MKHLFLNLIVLFATTFAFAQNVPSYVPTNGLVGWWPFNGNAKDESGNGNNGTVNGATLTTDRFGNTGKAYSFDGNDWIEILNSTSLNSATTVITFSAWFKIDNWYNVNNMGWFPISSKSNSSSSYGNYRCGFQKNASGTVGFYSTLNSETIGDTTNLQNSMWNHVLYTINDNNNSGSIYFNGILIYQGSTFYTGWPTVNNLPLMFGMDRPGLLDHAIGGLDDIGIWNRALTEQEITNLYNGNICYQTVSVTDTLRISTLAGFNTLPQEFGTVKVFPNPTNDLLNISIDKPNSNYTIKIMDNTSKAVYTSTMNSNSLQVNLNQFSSKGLYLIQILDNTNKVLDVRKLILE